MALGIAYFQILGKPFILYVGVLTLSLLLLTASISIMNRRGINKIPFKWHSRVAFVTIAVAIIHAIIGISAYI